MTSASPSVPTVRPRAPASACIRAIRTLLWVLTWGRRATPRWSMSAWRRWTFAHTRSTNTTSAGVSIPAGRGGGRAGTPAGAGCEIVTRAGYGASGSPCSRSRVPASLSAHPPPGGSMSRSVLIVDDEQHIRLLIEQTLEELADEGVDLYTASDGDEALAAIEAQSPDLVFLDVMMPKRNGLEVARAVRDELGRADTHIVLLTAKGQAVDREAGLAAGANRYLTKPFDPDELLAIAHDVLGPA